MAGYTRPFLFVLIYLARRLDTRKAVLVSPMSFGTMGGLVHVFLIPTITSAREDVRDDVKMRVTRGPNTLQTAT